MLPHRKSLQLKFSKTKVCFCSGPSVNHQTGKTYNYSFLRIRSALTPESHTRIMGCHLYGLLMPRGMGDDWLVSKITMTLFFG